MRWPVLRRFYAKNNSVDACVSVDLLVNGRRMQISTHNAALARDGRQINAASAKKRYEHTISDAKEPSLTTKNSNRWRQNKILVFLHSRVVKSTRQMHRNAIPKHRQSRLRTRKSLTTKLKNGAKNNLLLFLHSRGVKSTQQMHRNAIPKQRSYNFSQDCGRERA